MSRKRSRTADFIGVFDPLASPAAWFGRLARRVLQIGEHGVEFRVLDRAVKADVIDLRVGDEEDAALVLAAGEASLDDEEVGVEAVGSTGRRTPCDWRSPASGRLGPWRGSDAAIGSRRWSALPHSLRGRQGSGERRAAGFIPAGCVKTTGINRRLALAAARPCCSSGRDEHKAILAHETQQGWPIASFFGLHANFLGGRQIAGLDVHHVFPGRDQTALGARRRGSQIPLHRVQARGRRRPSVPPRRRPARRRSESGRRPAVFSFRW